MDCGDIFPYFIMDFDHREGTRKKFNISMVSQFSTKKELLKEIKKCDLVCSNCHRIRTWMRITKNYSGR